MSSDRNFQKNEIVQLNIEDMGNNGEGIGKADGFTFFVRDAVVGDLIEAKIMKLKKRYGYARLHRIIKPSSERVEPGCPIAGPCGGCQLQFLSYQEQMKRKEHHVAELLERIGGISDVRSIMHPIIGMEDPYHYRNKAQYPIGTDAAGHAITGFYGQNSHRIVPCEDCKIGHRQDPEILQSIREWMDLFHISAYDERTGKGLLRHVMIRHGYHSGETLVCLVINGKRIPHADELIVRLRAMEGMTSISVNINQKQTNVILGDQIQLLWGKKAISDRIGALWYEISPHSFFQVNPVQTEKLYAAALEFAAVGNRDTVMDLYCGIGTISLHLAQHAAFVYGVEIVPQAIEDAKNNALRNGMKNVAFYAGKSEEIVPKLFKEQDVHANVIVVDPPRKGCAQSLLQTIITHGPERIVYVSCDPATLARDVKILGEGGYELMAVQPVDMFPMVFHVESVVLMTRVAPTK